MISMTWVFNNLNSGGGGRWSSAGQRGYFSVHQIPIQGFVFWVRHQWNLWIRCFFSLKKCWHNRLFLQGMPTLFSPILSVKPDIDCCGTIYTVSCLPCGMSTWGLCANAHIEFFRFRESRCLFHIHHFSKKNMGNTSPKEKYFFKYDILLTKKSGVLIAQKKTFGPFQPSKCSQKQDITW